MYDPEIIHSLKPLHDVWLKNKDYKTIFNNFNQFWEWSYDLVLCNKENKYNPIVEYKKDHSDFDWSKCKKDYDMGKVLKKTYLKQKRNLRNKSKVNDLGNLLKCKEYNLYYKNKKLQFEEKLLKGELPVNVLLDEYYKRTGDTTFNTPQINTKKELMNKRFIDEQVLIIKARIDWSGGLVSGLKRVKIDCDSSGIKDVFTYLIPKVKIHNERWYCEKGLYTMRFNNLIVVYDKYKYIDRATRTKQRDNKKI